MTLNIEISIGIVDLSDEGELSIVYRPNECIKKKLNESKNPGKMVGELAERIIAYFSNEGFFPASTDDGEPTKVKFTVAAQ